VKLPLHLIIPSVVTVAIVAARQFAAGRSGKRIDVTGQASRGKPAAERNLVGIASVFGNAARLMSPPARLARAIRSRARVKIFPAGGQVATNAS
jgi:hypothetical protein